MGGQKPGFYEKTRYRRQKLQKPGFFGAGCYVSDVIMTNDC
jgi:hypothetical protein